MDRSTGDAAALRRVLIFGGGGLLGTALQSVLRDAGTEARAPSSQDVDIRDFDGVQRCLAEHEPDLVINTAAQSKVDEAERQSAEAFALNGTAAHNVALAAAQLDVPLVHISTDYVFDGQARRPYREVDPTGLPPSQYGQSKLLGELLVRQAWRRHYIVRVAALFGTGRADFVDWVLAKADPAQPLTIVADRVISPSWTDDVARQVHALVQTPYYGTYHATGHGIASWYELARSALELSGRDTAGVVPIPDVELVSVAPRPPYSALDNHLLRLRGLDCMLHWRAALAQYLRTRPAPAASQGAR